MDKAKFLIPLLGGVAGLLVAMKQLLHSFMDDPRAFMWGVGFTAWLWCLWASYKGFKQWKAQLEEKAERDTLHNAVTYISENIPSVFSHEKTPIQSAWWSSLNGLVTGRVKPTQSSLERFVIISAKQLIETAQAETEEQRNIIRNIRGIPS